MSELKVDKVSPRSGTALEIGDSGDIITLPAGSVTEKGADIASATTLVIGTDGDYFSKPSIEDIFEEVYEVMHELSPSDFPKLR